MIMGQADFYCTLMDNDNWMRDFRSTIFDIFLQFSQKVKKIKRLAISHLKALIVDNIMLGGQPYCKIKDRPDPWNIKKQSFQEKWARQAFEGTMPLSLKNFVGAIYWRVFELTLNSSRWAKLRNAFWACPSDLSEGI